MKFIHLSDLHIKSDNRTNSEIIRMFSNISKNYAGHYLIITGDITDDGDPEQYDIAYGLLKQFIGRIFICPGNHDFGLRGNQYSKYRAKLFDEKLSLPLMQGDIFFGDNNPVINKLKSGKVKVVLIALDTNLETNSTFDFACGQIGKIQLTALDKYLSDKSIKKMTKIIFMHHHPFIYKNPFIKLNDAYDLFDIIKDRADILLFGHNHKSGIWENKYGLKYILASDDSPGKNFVREIIIDKDNEIFINNIKIYN
jgi:predicted phosphodiesterase